MLLLLAAEVVEHNPLAALVVVGILTAVAVAVLALLPQLVLVPGAAAAGNRD